MTPRARKTIGLLTYGIWDTLGQSLWRGVHDSAVQHDVNLLTFEGWVLEDDDNRRAPANILYDLVSAEAVDGLIVLGGSIGQNLDPAGINAFFSQYADLPLVSIATEVEDVPSIILNNYTGMQLAIEHLIKVHDRKRIAFIRGPTQHVEANERFRAYTDTLKRHEIPVDSQLILQGDFRDISAERALLELLESGIEFDGVVAANDNMALGALRTLQANRFVVPDDVSVIGFDDIPEAKSSIPPLTSVSSQFNDYGRQSVDLLIAMLNGNTVPLLTSVALELVVRESCGCLGETVVKAGDISGHMAEVTQIEDAFESASAEIAQILGYPPGTHELIEQIFTSFNNALNHNAPLEFLRGLTKVLNDELSNKAHLESWHNAISVMRFHILPTLTEETKIVRAESLWGQARILIGKAITSKEIDKRAQEIHLVQLLREIGSNLVRCFDTDKLAAATSDALRHLKIPNAYVALYENPSAPQTGATLLFSHGQDQHLNKRRKFKTQELLSEDLLPRNRQYSMVVNALYFDSIHLGLVVFETGPKHGLVYDTLSTQISTAVYGSILIQQAGQYARALERAVSHTLSSAEQIRDTSEQNTLLAGKVTNVARASIEVSKSGQQAVDNTMAAMNTISEHVSSMVEHIFTLSEHTQQIGSIVLGVKDIADQSKILALNARIEAARAGAQGRGFSVVAQEMKNLAEQSSEATSQVREILFTIQKTTEIAAQKSADGKSSVDQGMELVVQAGNTISDLASVIAEAAQVAAEIENATGVQFLNIENLVDAIRALAQEGTTFGQTQVTRPETGLDED